VQEAHDEIIKKKKLPSVGQIVRSKMYNTLWRVVEKREIWQHTANFQLSGEDALLPAIFLAYWKVQKDVLPGIGNIIGYTYALYDNTFESFWDVVEDS
jgi:hypothetical protein